MLGLNKYLIAGFVSLLFVIGSAMVHSQTELPDHFIDELILGDLTKPVGVVFDHLGEGYLWEKDGLVWRFSEQGDKSSAPLIDIREEITSFGDHGLIGFALDPNFKENGWIYLFYAVDRHYLMTFGTSEYDPEKTISGQATISRITRYTADQSSGYRKVVDGSRKILVGKDVHDGLPILMGSHATGSLVFGEDGSLLYSFGDGGSFSETDIGNAKDTYHEQAIKDGIIEPSDNVGSLKAMQLATPNGKISRIDPATGDGLPSNPFYDQEHPRSHQSRIWVMGMRNPYKFIELQNTGSHLMSEGRPGVLLVGDVGGAQWEELNIVKEPGGWYGWPVFEGHEYRWGGIYKSEVQNPKTPSPGACQEHYIFSALWKDENEQGNYDFRNPCDSTAIPEDILTFIHKRPDLCYNSDKWNRPTRTLVPGFNYEGRAIGVPLPDSTSMSIEGGTILPAAINYFDGFPEEYKDKLFLGDYRGRISVVTMNEELQITYVAPFFQGKEGLTDFKFNAKSGALYYIDNKNGELRRISYGGTLPPYIETNIDRNFGPSPLAVVFDSRNSLAFNGQALDFRWDFGDGLEDTGSVVTHVFESTEIRSFDVAVIASDSEGRSTRENYQIAVNNTPPQVEIESIKDGSTYSLLDYNFIPLRAKVSDKEFSNDELDFAWRIDLYHDEHFHPGPIDPKITSIAQLDPVGCELEQYWYRINLSVTDPGGLSGSDYVEIFPYCGERLISFFDFTISLEGSGILTEWSVIQKKDIVQYEIERTSEHVFRTIGMVEDHGADAFSFVDPTPAIGRNIYRIKAIDEAGNYTYSERREINFQGEKGFFLYPIPSSETLYMTGLIHSPGDTHVNIRDMSGQLLMSFPITDTSEVFKKEIDVSELANGMYFLIFKDGDQVNWEKFTVTH